MKILIVGDNHHVSECQAKLGSSHTYGTMSDHLHIRKHIANYDVIFDFILDEEPDEFDQYASADCTLFVNSAKMSLAELGYAVGNQVSCTVFGFNGLPTLFNRSVLEISLLRQNDSVKLGELARKLGTEFFVVEDRVGLVTPRVICMIINEAYYTVQEGTATREDIDTAMKLGTNYPYGPFEWCQRIGIRHVYELLESVYEDTRDERYKICPLLKREYLACSI